jgi:predicted Zn-dependent protease
MKMDFFTASAHSEVIFQRIRNNSVFVILIVAWLIARSTFSYAGLADIEGAMVEGDYRKVQELSSQLVASSSDKNTILQAKYYLAVSNIRLEQYPQAQGLLEQLLTEKMELSLRDKVYLALCDTNYFQEKYMDALKTAEKILRLNPRSEFLSIIYLKLARAHLKLTHWKEAQGYLQKIVTTYPKSMEGYVARQLLEEKQYFSVQVGSFMDRQRAEGLMGELKKKGEYAFIVQTKDAKGQDFFRVRVGQLAVLNEAQQLKTKLSQQGYPARIYP